MKLDNLVSRRDVLSAGVAAGAAAFGFGVMFRKQTALEQLAPMPLRELLQERAIKPLSSELIPDYIHDELATYRQGLMQTAKDPDMIRFSMPKTTQFVQEIAWRLLEGSGFLVPHLTPVIAMNDLSWGLPSAKMTAGVLEIEPEGVGVMQTTDMVAALIAHELIHHLRGHSEIILLLKQHYSGEAADSMFGSAKASDKERAYRRGQEIEADVLSVLLLENAGYDAYAALDCLSCVHQEIHRDPRYSIHDRRADPIHGTLEERHHRIQLALTRWNLTPRPQSAAGFHEVYQELADRKRPGADSPRARDLYQHYNRRLP